MKARETQLHAAEQSFDMLVAAREELDAVIARGSLEGMSLLPAALRRLASTEFQLMEARMRADEARRQLLAAKGRQKALSRKARRELEVLERKEGEERSLETALGMLAKVSGKQGVVS